MLLYVDFLDYQLFICLFLLLDLLQQLYHPGPLFGVVLQVRR